MTDALRAAGWAVVSRGGSAAAAGVAAVAPASAASAATRLPVTGWNLLGIVPLPSRRQLRRRTARYVGGEAVTSRRR